MLKEKAVKNVRFKTAYCCTLEMKIIAEFGADKDAVGKALKEIGMSFMAILEATKV